VIADICRFKEKTEPAGAHPEDYPTFGTAP
jgi:hypothetical protein